MEQKSPHYRSVVVPYRPERKAAIAFLLVLICVVVGVSTYFFGIRSADNGYKVMEQQRDALQAELADLRSSLVQVRQDLANTTVGSEIDRAAMDDVRELLKSKNEKIAELSEENTFYKGLMAPSEREKGLSIRGWEVFGTADPRRFRYRMVVQQLALKHLLISGYVNIVVVGRMNNDEGETIEKSFHLNSLSTDLSDKNIRIRFKYFQNIEGELKLPSGFTPEQVKLVAKASKPKYVELEKNYVWSVQ